MSKLINIIGSNKVIIMSEPVEFDISGYTAVTKSAVLLEELKKIAPESTITLQAGGAKRLCTSSAQILMSFINEVNEKGGSITWGEQSKNFTESVHSAGWAEKLAIE